MPAANVKGQEATTTNDTVSTPCIGYGKMAEHWDLIHDLLGGTLTMRAAKTKWLPKEPAEPNEAYELRLGRSILYNAFKDTLDRLASKPFSKAVTVQGTLPDPLTILENDMDRTGRDLTQFSKELFLAGATYGLTHILVDYPRIPVDATMADERELQARPVSVHVQPPQLIGWKTTKGVGDSPQLSEIRIFEQRTEPAGSYLDVEVNYIRVYTTTTWEVWMQPPADDKNSNPAYVQISAGTHTFGRVPLITVYFGKQSAPLMAEPPMEELAWLNLAHWQSFSDQRNILRVMRCGILFGSGFSREEMENDMVVGPNRMVRTTNPEAQLRYVEHSGQAVGAGQQDIDKLENRMEIMGLQPLMSAGSGQPTATAKAIDEGQELSDIQSWIRSLELGLQSAYALAAEWAKVTLPEDFRIDVFSDFGLGLKSATDLSVLSTARQSGDVSRLTYLRELKRRGVLSDNVDVEAELERVEAEGPSLADVGTGYDPNAPAPEDQNSFPCPVEGCGGTMNTQPDGSAICDTCGLVISAEDMAKANEPLPCPNPECSGKMIEQADGSAICDTCGLAMTPDEYAQYVDYTLQQEDE